MSATLILRPTAEVAWPTGDRMEIDLPWAVYGAESVLDAVKEITADGDDTRLQTTRIWFSGGWYAALNGASFTFEPHTTETATIENVEICVVGRTEPSTQQFPNWGIIYHNINNNDGGMLGGTLMPSAYGVPIAIGGYSTNPDTGVAWEWDEIDAIQAGIAGMAPNGNPDDSVYNTRVTQLFLRVTYAYEPPVVVRSFPWVFRFQLSHKKV